MCGASGGSRLGGEGVLSLVAEVKRNKGRVYRFCGALRGGGLSPLAPGSATV